MASLPFRGAFAAFSLSVTPYEGGYDLRFGRVSFDTGRINREVNVSITTTLNKQYRLSQVLLEPLATAEGKQIPSQNFLVYAIRGTNRFGTINVDQDTQVNFNRQIIYTSNPSGSPDSFTLVYSLLPDGLESGSYRGRISFVLEAIDSSADSVTVFLNLLAEVEAKSGIDISTITGGKEIILKSNRQDADYSALNFVIKGALGRQFRIVQAITEQPMSSNGEMLDWDAVTFVGSGSKKGMVVNEETPLSNRQQILYTSSVYGDSDDFTIEYRLSDTDIQKAGVYKSRIKFYLEEMGGKVKPLDTFGLTIENSKIFDLNITPQDQRGNIEFRDLKPRDSPKQNEVLIEIKNNTGKKYQVTQNIYSNLTDAEGNTIPEQYFTVKTESIDTKGDLRFTQSTGAKKGDTVLFVSDDDGSLDKFRVIYELTVPWDIKAGDYSTRITYSLSEL